MGFYCPVGMCGQLTTTESTVKGLKRCLRDGIALSHEKEGNVAATELQPVPLQLLCLHTHHHSQIYSNIRWSHTWEEGQRAGILPGVSLES